MRYRPPLLPFYRAGEGIRNRIHNRAVAHTDPPFLSLNRRGGGDGVHHRVTPRDTALGNYWETDPAVGSGGFPRGEAGVIATW
jgi:hypothetical protein